MADIELQLRIENLKFFIQLKEQKYTVALHQGIAFAILQPLKDEIKKLKGALNVLLDTQCKENFRTTKLMQQKIHNK